MENQCSVLNCDSTPSATKVFYKFPLAFDSCMQWVQYTGDQKLVQEFAFGGAQPFIDKFICSDHFLEGDFAIFGNPHSGLRCQAIPLVKKFKKKPKVTNKSESPVNTELATVNRISCDVIPINEDLKIEPEEIDLLEPQIDVEDSTINRLKSQTIPLIKKLKKKRKVTYKSQSPINTKDTTVNRISCDVVPVTEDLKREPEEIDLFEPQIDIEDSIMSSCDAASLSDLKKEPKAEDMPDPPNNTEDVTVNSFTQEAVPVIVEVPLIMRIKEEPEPKEIENSLPLPFPLIHQEHENMRNVCSDPYEAISGGNLTEEPQLTESPLSLPTSVFSLADANLGRKIPIINIPKTEEGGIEEVLILENDTSLLNTSELGCVTKPLKSRSSNVRQQTDAEKRRKDALRQSIARKKETSEQRAARLEKTRIRAQKRRQAESNVETTIRRYKSAMRAAIKRSGETEEQRRLRQDKNKTRAAERRKNMTPEEKEEWKMKNRVQTRERRQNESDIKKIVRRYNNALRASLKRSRETPEQRAERRIKDALRAAERRKSETQEEREERLRKDRERITLRRMELLMTETPEQREARLKKERERMWRKRHGIKGEPKGENDVVNVASESPNGNLDISESSLLNFNPIFPTILSMLPPNINMKTQDNVEDVQDS